MPDYLVIGLHPNWSNSQTGSLNAVRVSALDPEDAIRQRVACLAGADSYKHLDFVVVEPLGKAKKLRWIPAPPPPKPEATVQPHIWSS